MASGSDVRYAQLQYEENRKLGEGIRKQQDSLDQKRGRMGLGRSLFSIGGTLLGAAFGPVGMAVGAGLGSALGSHLGAKSVKIDEVDKGKLYKGTVDEVRRQGRGALKQMNDMALRGILTDAASAYAFAGTDIGKATQAGATGKVAGLGADAGLLQKAWASGSGAVAGGAGHIKGSILNAMRPEATTPVIPELTELQGGFGGDYLQEGLGRLPTGLDPEQIKMTEQAMASGLAPWQAAETAPWRSALESIGATGNDVTKQATLPINAAGEVVSDIDPFNFYKPEYASTASDATGFPTQLANIAQDNATRTTVPLADAMQQNLQYQGPQFGNNPLGTYDPLMQADSLNSWNYPGYKDELARFRASRDQYGRAIVGGG